jgi:hypothetical protein
MKPNVYISPGAAPGVRKLFEDVFPDANMVSKEEMEELRSAQFETISVSLADALISDCRTASALIKALAITLKADDNDVSEYTDLAARLSAHAEAIESGEATE